MDTLIFNNAWICTTIWRLQVCLLTNQFTCEGLNKHPKLLPAWLLLKEHWIICYGCRRYSAPNPNSQQLFRMSPKWGFLSNVFFILWHAKCISLHANISSRVQASYARTDKATSTERNWHPFPRVAILLKSLWSSCFWATQTPWFFPKHNSFIFSQKAKSLSRFKGAFFLYGIFTSDGTLEQPCLFISPCWQSPKAQTGPPVRVCRKRDATYIFCDI